jgi:hypothetical protein
MGTPTRRLPGSPLYGWTTLRTAPPMTTAGSPPNGNDPAAVTRLLADAARVAQVHAEDDGWCRGCIEVWAHVPGATAGP